jgi:hypothetical protein
VVVYWFHGGEAAAGEDLLVPHHSRTRVRLKLHPNYKVHCPDVLVCRRALLFPPRSHSAQNLWEQFQKKANIYFLIIAILSLTPVSPKPAFVSIAPLVFVLAVTAIKEAIEDYRRYLMDKAVNSREVEFWDTGAWKKKPWQDVKVGDMLYLRDNAQFPADLIILQSSIPQGICNIETANLDGFAFAIFLDTDIDSETNLKIKSAISATYEIECEPDGLDFPTHFKASFESSPPSPKMDKNSWSGNLVNLNGSSGKLPLNFSQLCLRVPEPQFAF